jgi:hypothetical protein
MKGELERAELNFAVSVTAPLFWAIRQANGGYVAKNGSAFFLNTGKRLFGVTAHHVIEEWRHDRSRHDEVHYFLSGQGWACRFTDDWLIDADPAIDIATFDITPEQLKLIDRAVLTGPQKSWPPAPPKIDGRIYYCGFPGLGRVWPSPSSEIRFGTVVSSGAASSVSELDISTVINREYLHPILGQGVPPEDFDYGGMSGGPILSVVETPLHSWVLAGIIYPGPNPSGDPEQSIAGLNIIKARRAHFILPDGTLDRALWHATNPPQAK